MIRIHNISIYIFMLWAPWRVIYFNMINIRCIVVSYSMYIAWLYISGSTSIIKKLIHESSESGWRCYKIHMKIINNGFGISLVMGLEYP